MPRRIRIGLETDDAIERAAEGLRVALQEAEEPNGVPERFEGVLIVEGIRSGDDREIAPGALDHRDLPLPLLLPNDMGGHGSDRIAGQIDSLERVESGGTAEWRMSGRFDLSGENGREAARLVSQGFLRWVSADLDDIGDIEFIEEGDCSDEGDEIIIVAQEGEVDTCRVIMRLLEGRIMGGTLVPFPAFQEAVVTAEGGVGADEPEEGMDTEGQGFDIVGATDLPIADRETEWDGPGAAERVFELCSENGEDVDVSCVSRAFLWRNPDEEGAAQEHYSLGFADVFNGMLQIVPAGVAATAGGRGVDEADIPEADKDRIKSRICLLYDRLQEEFDDWPDCPFEDEGNRVDARRDPIEASAEPERREYAVVDERPPAAWFDDPGLDEPMPLTVTDDGRVYGHLATWGQCHTGVRDACLMAPRSESDYAYFHTGEVETREGDRRRVGQLTMGCGHADRALGHREAAAHYDGGPGAVQWADVAVGEDEHGVWVAGAVRPDVDEATIRRARANAISGDWRRIGGALELVAALSVPVPGFPITASGGEVIPLGGTRLRERDGEPWALVAAGVIARGTGCSCGSDTATAERLERLERAVQVLMNATADDILASLDERMAHQEA